MADFVTKNKYNNKLSLHTLSIVKKLTAMGYIKKLGMDTQEAKKIGYEKIMIMRSRGVDSKEDVQRLSNISTQQLRYGFPKRNPVTGEFQRKDAEVFVQREGTIIKKLWVEMPQENSKKFEEAFCSICADLNIRLF